MALLVAGTFIFLVFAMIREFEPVDSEKFFSKARHLLASETFAMTTIQNRRGGDDELSFRKLSNETGEFTFSTKYPEQCAAVISRFINNELTTPKVIATPVAAMIGKVEVKRGEEYDPESISEACEADVDTNGSALILVAVQLNY